MLAFKACTGGAPLPLPVRGGASLRATVGRCCCCPALGASAATRSCSSTPEARRASLEEKKDTRRSAFCGGSVRCGVGSPGVGSPGAGSPAFAARLTQ